MDGQDAQDKRFEISNLKSEISAFFILPVLPIHVNCFRNPRAADLSLPLQFCDALLLMFRHAKTFDHARED